MHADDPGPGRISRDIIATELPERVALLVCALLLVGLAGFVWIESARPRDALPIVPIVLLGAVGLAGGVLLERRLVIDPDAGTIDVQLRLALSSLHMPIAPRRTLPLRSLEAVSITPIRHKNATLWYVALVHHQGDTMTIVRRARRATADAEARQLADELKLELRAPPAPA